MAACRFLVLAILVTGCTLSPCRAQGTTTLSGGTAALSGGATIRTPLHWNTSAAAFTPGDGTVVFVADGDQTLTPATDGAFFNIILDKPAGDLVLAGPIAVQGTLTLLQGSLDLNTFSIDLGATGRLVETPGHAVKGAAGTITAQRTLVAPTAEHVAGLGAALTSSATLGETTITRGHAVQIGEENTSVLRYYDIAPTTNAGLDATLAFSYRESELNGHLEDGLSLYRSVDGGATWIERGGVVDTAANTVTLTGIDAFSRWTLGSFATPLPVELVSFAAQRDGQAVMLRWQTASETNNAGFEIQHHAAEDGPVPANRSTPSLWAVRAFVDGHGTTLEPQAYRYRVEALEPGLHTFRLRQVDFDGTFAYSPEVEVTIEAARALALHGNYPNPFRLQTTIRFTVPIAGPAELTVHDLQGRRVQTLFDRRAETGRRYAVTFTADGLASGTYFYRLRFRDQVRTGRMLLVK